MQFGTKLGVAEVLGDGEGEHDKETGIWRYVHQVPFTLSSKGIRAMNLAADSTGGVELVVFDEVERHLTIVVATDADPAATLKLWWKQFRTQIRRHEPDLTVLVTDVPLFTTALAVSGTGDRHIEGWPR